MSFRVHVDPSGHEFTVEQGESVLSAALRQGYTLPYGCRNGACGSCKGRIASGQVHYPSDKTDALEPDDEQQGLALFCQAEPLSDLTIVVREIRLPGEVEIKRLPARAMHLDRLSHDVMRIRLKLPATERLQFIAGQYIEFLLKDGKRRAFSIANAPHEDEFIELHVRHVEGGRFTDYVFAQMKEKAIVRIEGPLGTFFLREQSPRPILMMGGGTGFAPLKGMVEHALRAGIERPIHLYWGVRSLRDIYLADLPERWTAEHDNVRYTPVLSEPLPEDAWTGRTGWVHEAVLADYPDLAAHEVYMSGPPAMIEAAKTSFNGVGLPEDALYFDSFDYAEDY